MSRFLSDNNVCYYRFQKLFNSFDIYLKRELVGYLSEFENNNYLRYFNDENNVKLCDRKINPHYLNASQITLNNDFFGSISNQKIMTFMENIINKYSRYYLTIV
jgi:hypothetical protein